MDFPLQLLISPSFHSSMLNHLTRRARVSRTQSGDYGTGVPIAELEARGTVPFGSTGSLLTTLKES